MSMVGYGWELRAFGLIQRTARTLAQDNVSGMSLPLACKCGLLKSVGSVNYDANDRYTLNGQRLMHISGNEYRLAACKLVSTFCSMMIIFSVLLPKESLVEIY